ncbi:hypothetical protein QFB55_004903 [Salmonella enterica]|nr:hypothetical protein [Salmonella enterica]
MKTALVFLAGPPDATNTTVSTDRSAANADNKETITVTLTPRDSHNNVVPLWTFRKDLTIVPSVNATVPGAVTVTTPAQDAAGNVAATLTYVDTSGQLLSKAARTGTTSVSIGSGVKKTVDTRFYPKVSVCATNIGTNNLLIPGSTALRLCDGGGHEVSNPEGYRAVTGDGTPCGSAVIRWACPILPGGNDRNFDLTYGSNTLDNASASLVVRVTDTFSGHTFDPEQPLEGKTVVIAISAKTGEAFATDSGGAWGKLIENASAAFKSVADAKLFAEAQAITLATPSHDIKALIRAAGSAAKSTVSTDPATLTTPAGVIAIAGVDELSLTTLASRYSGHTASRNDANVWAVAHGPIGQIPVFAIREKSQPLKGQYAPWFALTNSMSAATPAGELINLGDHPADIYGDTLDGQNVYAAIGNITYPQTFRCNSSRAAPLEQHDCSGDLSYPFLTKLVHAEGAIGIYSFARQ